MFLQFTGNKRADNSFFFIHQAVLVILLLTFSIFLICSEMKVKVYTQFTYKSDSPLNVGVLKTAAPDGLVRLVQLPGDAKISEKDDQIGQDGAEHGQSHDEGGVIQRVPVARPVNWASKSEGLGPIAAPAQEGEDGPQAGIQPDCTDHNTDGFLLELDTWNKHASAVKAHFIIIIRVIFIP